MDVLVAYDVATESSAGRRRLRRVAQACQAYGQRVQKSVFECALTEAQLERLMQRLLAEIDQTEDSLRVYRLVEPRERNVRVYGIDHRIDLATGPLIV
ncbi:MAG: CRISPR-associated endonuclease Cas2 [Actinobacteria bacterium]|nr:CRISPR-associated endonuclease Cas2 [Actinomycetota bacterium]